MNEDVFSVEHVDILGIRWNVGVKKCNHWTDECDQLIE